MSCSRSVRSYENEYGIQNQVDTSLLLFCVLKWIREICLHGCVEAEVETMQRQELLAKLENYTRN